MQQWEYKTLDNTTGRVTKKANVDPEEKLNELGRNGWELVGTIEQPLGAGGAQTRTLIFKRPKE